MGSELRLRARGILLKIFKGLGQDDGESISKAHHLGLQFCLCDARVFFLLCFFAPTVVLGDHFEGQRNHGESESDDKNHPFRRHGSQKNM